MRRLRLTCSLLAFLSGTILMTLATAPVAAQSIIIIANLDAGTGTGLDDPTPVAPVGGNPGTTLGEQRLNVFLRAADIWANLLNSEVPIRVEASFAALDCDRFSALLGQAGPITFFRDFPGTNFTGTWFPVAVANSRAGEDLDPDGNDIVAEFNGAIDNNNRCLFGTNWYLGLDGNPPGNDIDFYSVILHELAHGFGFLTVTNIETGELALGFPDIWSRRLFDMGVVSTWQQMTDEQRQASAISDGDLVWTGGSVLQEAASLNGGLHPSFPVIQMFAPPEIQPGSSVSHFDVGVDPDDLMEPSFTTPMVDVGLADNLLEDITWDTNDPAFTMLRPIPGEAGGDNLLTAFRGTPGSVMAIYYGSAEGATAIMAGCPNLGIANATLLDAGLANARGELSFTLEVPGIFAGGTILFQALKLDGVCSVSNVVAETF